MSIKVKGKIVVALPETSGTSKSGNAWRKREYVIETSDKYPKKIAFSVMNDNIAKCNLVYGEEVEVDLDIESREFNGRWYTSCSAWGANHLTPQPQVAPQAAPYPPQQSYGGYPQQSPQPTPPADDDLPF